MRTQNTPSDNPLVLFDARYMRTDFHDGISRYSAELGTELSKRMPITFLICDDGQKKWLPANARSIKIHSPDSFKESFTAFILNKYKPSVVYSPMQTIGSWGKRYKLILTVHDLIYYRHKTPPHNLPTLLRFGWWVYHLTYWPERFLLTGADVITSVSKTSAADMRAARLTHKPITVVYNAAQEFKDSAVRHKKTVQNIVYMGSFMPYKNVETLVQAMHWLPGRTLHLLSKITPKRQAELQALAPNDTPKDTPKHATLVFHNGVSDAEYQAILADNAVLVSASLDEGYGIPVAEAMGMNVPVVISDMPIFREVGGSGALYVNPHSPQQFAEAIKKLDDADFRKKHIEKGRAHADTFSWAASAEVLKDTINSLL